MRVAVEDLANRLSQSGPNSLPKIVLINGNEPLLIEEALDKVRAVVRTFGFDERIKHQLEVGFDWTAITGVGQMMSLFSERRLIELRIPKSLGVAGSKAIIEFCNTPSEDDILLLLMPALDKRQRQSKWVKVVENSGWIADGLDVSPQQFPHWLKQRLQSRSLRVESGVVEVLVEHLEGNLLAAAQEIDKLQVLAEDGAVTLKLLSDSLADQTRFDVYRLSDLCLAGEFTQVVRVLQRLRSEGVEPVIVVWALVREVRLLALVSTDIDAGKNTSAVFKQHRIWRKREPVVKAALARISTVRWYQILEQVAYLDQSLKGQRYREVGSIWYQIELLCTAFCGLNVVNAAATV